MIKVSLSPEEIKFATDLGELRHNESIRQGKKDAHGLKISREEAKKLDIIGAIGELAVAVALGIPFDATVNTWKAPDLGDLLQVRTATKHNYSLLVRPGDKDEEVFVLTTCENLPDFHIHGWLWGKEAKQKQWLRSPHGRPAAYFVPISELNMLE